MLGWGKPSVSFKIMKIIGGSFGADGEVHLKNGDRISILGSTNAEYTPDQMAKIISDKETQKKFGVVGFIVGSILLAAVLASFLNVLGIIIAVVAAAMWSRQTKETRFAHVTFEDGNTLKLECTNEQLNALYAARQLHSSRQDAEA